MAPKKGTKKEKEKKNTPIELGQLVFAKAKGYPPWPARVEEYLGKGRFKVFYFGTHQYGTCLNDDLLDYGEGKDELGKPRKQRSFNIALDEIVSTPDLDPENNGQQNLEQQQPQVALRRMATPTKQPPAKKVKLTADAAEEANEVQPAVSEEEPALPREGSTSEEAFSGASSRQMWRRVNRARFQRMLDQACEEKRDMIIRVELPAAGVKKLLMFHRQKLPAELSQRLYQSLLDSYDESSEEDGEEEEEEEGEIPPDLEA